MVVVVVVVVVAATAVVVVCDGGGGGDGDGGCGVVVFEHSPAAGVSHGGVRVRLLRWSGWVTTCIVRAYHVVPLRSVALLLLMLPDGKRGGV